ncbi:MAG: hypothetical protein KKF26_02010 [Chloroflexi bacterium]|nr:hypothetical protein [Chloroflexota bacterium]
MAHHIISPLWTADEIARSLVENRVPRQKVSTPADVTAAPQLKAREGGII